MSDYATLCYGEEGARLDQAFNLTFKQHEPPPPPVILLKGDSGTGKSYIVSHLAQIHNVTVHSVTLGELAAAHRGQLTKGFKRLIWKASTSNNSLVLIEDLDLFFPRQGQEDTGLLSIVSSLAQQAKLMLIATTRRPDYIAFDVRPLFQDEIHLQIPTPDERFHMMRYIYNHDFLCAKTLSDQDIQLLSSKAHAFVAADISQWCRLAEEDALIKKLDQVNINNFDNTFSDIRVSGLQNSAMAEKPDPVYWKDIGGLVTAKNALEESAVWIYKHADAYKRLGIRPSKGVLLFGPPGTGKTLLAKAVATESSANFLPVSIPDLIKGEVGESEKAVSRIFQTAIRCSPCVIFLDELEAIFSSRDTTGDVGRKLISQFLIEIDHLDKVDKSVILLGATNHPESIDNSILRPGRLDRLVYVGAPNLEERVQILQVLRNKTKVHPDINLEEIASKTEGYTGADLQAVIRKAGLLSLKQNLLQITQENILKAIESVSPSVIVE
ncbi:P-loop containing nucleoside triphosphate hydrolase protein [Helicostylum pulchrum]|nr:P-loop containing nucleoside triphosphate hydrolase protein [Helicostylum pulchrum]